jgi:hypothetical protein
MRNPSLGLAIGSLVVCHSLACGGSAPAANTPSPANTGDTVSTTPSAAPTSAAATNTATAEPTATPAEAGTGKLDIPPYRASSERVMQAHFNDALLIRQAVIAGKREEAANPATVIAHTQNLDQLPNGWRPFVEDMQHAATRITNGTTVATVAAATADLGVACGACHQQLGGPKATLEGLPTNDPSLEGRMKRHAWATERLWEGLAIPSDEAWKLGASLLSREAIPKEVLTSVDSRSAAADFAKLITKAPGKKTLQDKAGLYAELLLTCGVCHRAMTD